MRYLETVYIFCFLFTKSTATIIWDNVWINISHPDVNGTEIEAPPNATYLDSLCPAGIGTLAIQCMDANGETFHGYKEDHVNGYTVACDPRLGILCNPDHGLNRTCPDFAMNFGCYIPDTTTAAHTSRASQYGSSPTQHKPGLNQTTLKSGQTITLTHSGLLIPTFTNSNGQTGTGTSVCRSTTSRMSNTDTLSNTSSSPLVGTGNQKSGTGTTTSRTTKPRPSGTNILSITTRLGGVDNQKSGTGTSVFGSTSPYPSVTKTISDTLPIGGAGNQLSGTGSNVSRTTTTDLSKTNTVSKQQPLSGAGTRVPLITTRRLSATKSESNTPPLGGNRNGGKIFAHDKLLFYVICVFTLCRKLFY